MPTDLNALSALPCRVMPWPTPPSSARRSTRTTSTPFCARASDSTPPVMPPPTTRTRCTDPAISDSCLVGVHRRLGAGDPADDLVAVRAGGGDVGDLLAPVEDHDPVRHLVAQRQVVGDEHDRDALVRHGADQPLDILGLLVAQGGG